MALRPLGAWPGKMNSAYVWFIQWTLAKERWYSEYALRIAGYRMVPSAPDRAGQDELHGVQSDTFAVALLPPCTLVLI